MNSTLRARVCVCVYVCAPVYIDALGQGHDGHRAPLQKTHVLLAVTTCPRAPCLNQGTTGAGAARGAITC